MKPIKAGKICKFFGKIMNGLKIALIAIWNVVSYLWIIIKNNWIVILVIVLIVSNILVIIFLNSNLFKEIFVSFISISIGITGISIVDYRSQLKKKLGISKVQSNVVNRFNEFFKNKLNYELKYDRLSDTTSEKDILRQSIRNYHEENIDEQGINSLILYYYCKKWDKTHSSEDFQQIQKQSQNIGLKYGEITLDIHNFLSDYSKLVLGNLEELSDNELLKMFVDRHYKDLQFYEIKEELFQSKNLHETLVRIIQVGRLSTYGINQDTLNRLRSDLESSNFRQNTYLVLANKIPENLKQYLRSLPGLSGFPPSVRNIDDIDGKFSGYIVRPPEANTPKEFLEILKRKVGRTDEAYIIRIITLDFLNSLVYTLPEDQSFTTQGLKSCYEAIEWFRTGYIMDDSVLWNEIAKSTIGPDELLGLIPFNIFCRGIIPSEQAFFIQYYNEIKDSFNVNGLAEWRDVDAGLLRDRLLSYGQPNYSEEEYVNILRNDNQQERVEAVRSRILDLCNSIIEGSRKFHDSVQYQL